ncbi:MAG TPA: recombinase RecA, partial [Candidatus Acidoferrales bacterium]|nr:recombinase RecA [Candidatus Acidoferrales bacterium]
GEGVSREGDLIDLGVTKGILEKSGTWLSYKGERIGQGRENARVFLRDNAEIREKIDHELRKSLGLIPAGSSNGDKKPSAESEKSGAPKAAAAQAGKSGR